MPTFPYQRGYIAAIRYQSHATCPYTATDSSNRRWRQEWLNGHYDGWLKREALDEEARIKERKARWITDGRCEQLKLQLAARPDSYPRRRRVRAMPRSVYARKRIEQIIASWGKESRC